MALALWLVPAASAATLRFGRAAVDITPPKDMPFHVAGLAFVEPPYPVVTAEGTHDPVYAKAIVFESGGVKAAIVACDITSIPDYYITAAREHVARICTVPPENVMITATHTHTGPNVRPRKFAAASPIQMKVATAYLKRLPEMMAESVKAAEDDLTEARLHAAIGEVHGIAFNRRFLMKNGTVVSNPGKRDDKVLVDVVRPAGPTDPELPLLYLDTSDGNPLATVLNFALHLDTTGGPKYSADFPYQISKILSDVKGAEMLTHFTYGAAGNINHYYLLDPERPHRTKGYQESARIGTHIASEVVRSYRRLRSLDATAVKVSREVVRLDVHEDRVPEAARENGYPDSFKFNDTVYTMVDGRYTFPAEVMVITVGEEVAFVGVPGELFVELGLMIKRGSPYQFTFVNSNANGSIGYLADRKAYSEGAYGASVESTRASPGSGESLVDSAIHQLIVHRDIQPTLR